MKIVSARVRVINIPFKIIFKHSLSSRSEVKSLILELETDSGMIGYGEAVPRSYVTGETVESVEKGLLETVLPRLKNISFDNEDSVLKWLDSFEEYFPELGEKELCVRCLVDLALLDLTGKTFNTSVLEMLGGSKVGELVYSGVITAGKKEIVWTFLKACQKGKLSQIKMKVGKDLKKDLKNVDMVRKMMGDDVSIRIDANACWDMSAAQINLDEYDSKGIVSCEQPMPVECRDDYPILTDRFKSRLEIMLDESLCSYNEALWMAENCGATGFNLRISKNGGLVNSLKIYHLAKKYNIKCQLGAQVGETSILSNAGRILGVLTGDLLFHEGSFGTRLLSYDLTKSPTLFNKMGIGDIDSLKEKGLGVDVNLKLIEKMTVRKIKSF